MFIDPSMEHPHLVVCGIKDEATLEHERGRIEAYGIKTVAFHEPDRNGEMTAIATAPLCDVERRPMRRYKLHDR